MFTTAGAEVFTKSGILDGNAALTLEENPRESIKTILYLKRFILFPLINCMDH